MEPILRVVRGEPTAEELAALTAVVTAASGTDVPPPDAPRRGRWNDPARAHRRTFWRTGAGAWSSDPR